MAKANRKSNILGHYKRLDVKREKKKASLEVGLVFYMRPTNYF